MTLSLHWSAQSRANLDRMQQAMAALGPARFGRVAVRVTNRVGDMARTQVRRELTKQTGLPRKLIVAAVRVKRANISSMDYVMTARGGQIALKYFKPRETRRGVSAAPRGERQVFDGTFMKGGRFPNRVPLNMDGHVFKRAGTARFPIKTQKSDVTIPGEMVTGATAAAFDRIATTVFPRRLAHEVSRATGGVFR